MSSLCFEGKEWVERENGKKVIRRGERGEVGWHTRVLQLTLHERRNSVDAGVDGVDGVDGVGGSIRRKRPQNMLKGVLGKMMHPE